MKRLEPTTVLAMLLCLGGAATVFLPWAQVSVMRGEPQTDPTIMPKAIGPIQLLTVYGSQLWHGRAAALIFIAAFLFLIITGPIRPVPVWRSAGLFLWASLVIGAMLVGSDYDYVLLTSQPTAGRWVSWNGWGMCAYLPIGVAVLILLVAAFELRGKVVQSVAEPGV